MATLAAPRDCFGTAVPRNDRRQCHCEQPARQGLAGESVAISILISSTGIASSPQFIGAPCNDRKVRRLGFDFYHFPLFEYAVFY